MLGSLNKELSNRPQQLNIYCNQRNGPLRVPHYLITVKERDFES